MLLLFVKDDLSYDKYHRNAKNIYRIEFSITHDGVTTHLAQSQALLGPTLKNEYPDIKKVTRIYFSKRNLVKTGYNNNYEDRIVYADSAFFEIFSYQAVAGDITQFLKKPNRIILTESTAKKYFGKENPLGKTIEIDNQYSFEVTGVIKDVPFNSHFKFDFIAPYSSLDKQPVAGYFPQWGATFGSYTYMLADKGFDPKTFEKKTENFFSTHIKEYEGGWRVVVRPLLDIHLNSHSNDEIEENSSISRIIIIGSIALFILLLAMHKLCESFYSEVIRTSQGNRNAESHWRCQVSAGTTISWRISPIFNCFIINLYHHGQTCNAHFFITGWY